MAHHQPIRKSNSPAGKSAPAAVPAEIPDKLYFRIGEVARLCAVPPYVLRFWETEFPQFKPNKGGTGQRLFRRRDVEMAFRIKRLLYDEGYTIPGARQLLKVESKTAEPQLTLLAESASRDRDAQLRTLRQDLHGLLTLLQATPGPARLPARPARRATVVTLPSTDRLFDFPTSESVPSKRHRTPSETPLVTK